MGILSENKTLLRNITLFKREIIDAAEILRMNGNLDLKINPIDIIKSEGDTLPDGRDPNDYWEERDAECERVTGFPDYVARERIRTGRHPRMPFYRLNGSHWANPCMSPYPSLMQVLTIAAAGKCDVKILGYSPKMKRVLEDLDLFHYEHDLMLPSDPARMIDDMTSHIGAPDSRVYKLVMKKRIFRRPILYVYLTTDDYLDDSIYLDYDGNHVYPNPDEFEVKI